MESDFAGLTLNEEEEKVLQIQPEPQIGRECGVFQLVGCFLTANTIHFPAMERTMAKLWHPLGGTNPRFRREKVHDIPIGLFSESWQYSWMELGVEATNMSWDLSLRVQSRRDIAMSSVWLCGEEERDWGEIVGRGIKEGRRSLPGGRFSQIRPLSYGEEVSEASKLKENKWFENVAED
ncbi:hypothetical protein PVK06_041371 [Gossypium arboreum]|uniref:DUF4283 domain-containing protein n=1 Tax=Gossypium arboreum TaxID=29729 RepID=A0ABR0N808_GOSAR|nr:hypothetical protein PVK06_041371 [Gossypium arboreum]